jgi:isocitrate dehydrogenase (NAD+)
MLDYGSKSNHWEFELPYESQIEVAKEHFGGVLAEQLARVEYLKNQPEWLNFKAISPIKIGMIGGDGIGPTIVGQTQDLLEYVLRDQVRIGKVEFRTINGLTIENRAANMKSLPDEVLSQIRECHVTLKGPTHTPEKGDEWPNLESANVAMRKELDLFANVRPVRVPSKGIDWIFFRENTEDMYAVGNQGLKVTEDLGIDFRVITMQGSERIIEAAFAHAQRTGKDTVTVVTKANIVKTTDGNFLDAARSVSKRYPGIMWEGWYIDIMTAALINPARQKQFQVLVMPNLYGDILTDEAAQIQGGVGTAGSANIGKVFSMFEAIHGSAPRMVKEGRAQYADPSSVIRAGAMLLEHIGFPELGAKLNMALDICGQYERKMAITGRQNGVNSAQYTEYLMQVVEDQNMEERWESYVKADQGVP